MKAPRRDSQIGSSASYRTWSQATVTDLNSKNRPTTAITNQTRAKSSSQTGFLDPDSTTARCGFFGSIRTGIVSPPRPSHQCSGTVNSPWYYACPHSHCPVTKNPERASPGVAESVRRLRTSASTVTPRRRIRIPCIPSRTRLHAPEIPPRRNTNPRNKPIRRTSIWNISAKRGCWMRVPERPMRSCFGVNSVTRHLLAGISRDPTWIKKYLVGATLEAPQ